jgi:hypothetical protein
MGVDPAGDVLEPHPITKASEKADDSTETPARPRPANKRQTPALVIRFVPLRIVCATVMSMTAPVTSTSVTTKGAQAVAGSAAWR